MLAPKTSVNVNVTYDIHQQPASEFRANQRNAFVAAGIPYHSHGTAGSVTSCTSFGVSTLQTLPRALGGTGFSEEIALDADALQLAGDYYRCQGGYDAETELMQRAQQSAAAKPQRSPTGSKAGAAAASPRRSPIYAGTPPISPRLAPVPLTPNRFVRMHSGDEFLDAIRTFHRPE